MPQMQHTLNPAPPALVRPTGAPRRLTTFSTGVAELDDLAAQHDQLAGRHRDLAADVKAKQEARRRAEIEDERAGVAAAIAGKKDPGSPRTTEATAAVTAATGLVRRQLGAANLVADQYAAAFRGRQDEIAEIARARLSEARAQALTAFAKLASAAAQLDEARAFARWSQSGPSAPPPVRVPRHELASFGDRHLTVAAALEVLRTALEAPSRVERGAELVSIIDQDPDEVDEDEADEDGPGAA